MKSWRPWMTRAGLPRDRPPLDVPERLALPLRRYAHRWALVVAFVLLIAALLGQVPQSPASRTFEVATQLALLGLAAVATVLAARWEGLGGAMLVLAGVGLGVLASLQWHPLISLLVALLFIVPGTILLVVWQRSRSWGDLVILLSVLLVLLTAGGVGASSVYEQYFGAAHPQSSLQPVDSDLTRWVWAGATTSTRFTVTAKLQRGVTSPVLLVSTDADLDGALQVPPTTDPDDNRVVTFVVGGLQPATTYHYAVAAPPEAAEPDPRRGTVTTFPDGPASFTLAFGACARVGSNGQVFEAIAAADPLLYLITGDWFYGDVVDADGGMFAELYDRTLTQPAQSALYTSTSIAYVWDDHDYGANDSDAGSPARRAAIAAFDAWVPHYPFALPSPDGPIAQAFDVGRVRVLLTDTRSQRTESTMLGQRQLEWLIDELAAAATDDDIALVVWVSSVPWIGEASDGADDWSGHPQERSLLGDTVHRLGLPVLMLAGDAHMVAIDDGSNSEGGVAVFHAAALDRPGSVKGGPYSEGTRPGGGQFGLVTIHDHGGSTIDVELSGRDWTGAELLGHRYDIDVVPAPTEAGPR